MNTTTSCNDAGLHSLLKGHESSHEYQSALQHVDSCSACQVRLEQMAADSGLWQEAHELLTTGEGSAAGDAEADEISFPWNRHPIAWSESMAKSLLSPPSHPEMLGRVGRYDVERLIGSGGMGVVFKAWDTELNRPVAVKLLAPYLAENGSARKRFAREARAAAAVVDDHVVPIHNVETGDEPGSEPPFLVMKYIAGGSLQQRLDRDGPLDVCEILRIGMQAAKGLAAAHAQGLIHRDVKPSNILLDEGVERALLTDFGLARAEDDASMTRTGVIAGTPQYMSPEQVEAKAMDGRSDLFSLGSVLYAMACGHPPFRGDGSFEVLKRVRDEQPRPLHEIDPAIPVWFDNLVARLHEKSADDRPRSAVEVHQMLCACLLHVTHPDKTLPTELLRRATTHRSRRGVVFGGIGLVALALMGFAIFMQPPDSEAENKSDNNANQVVAAKQKGKQIGTVLGKPIYEGDMKPHLSDSDNLDRLLLTHLMEQYCRNQGIDRAKELEERIKDSQSRLGAQMFVTRWELQRHLYKKYGGRVVLDAFGPSAVDGYRKWIEERKQAGDYVITDRELQTKFDAMMKGGEGERYASPDQIKEAFDPANTERFIENFAKIPAGAYRDPNNKLIGVVLGKPLYLHQRYRKNKLELPGLLKSLFLTPLEKHYRQQHPELEPTDAEIDYLAESTKANSIESTIAARKSLETFLRRARKVNPTAKDDPETLAAIKEFNNRLERLRVFDGRFQAAESARPFKFQKYLFDSYGGGRVLLRPKLIAFDAQRKWVEERERLGEFQIADAELRRQFYDTWNNGALRHGNNLIDDPKQTQAAFEGTWLARSTVTDTVVPSGVPVAEAGPTKALKVPGAVD